MDERTDKTLTTETVSEETYPKVPVIAQVSGDGHRITLIVPQEFIQANVAVGGDANGRHRIILDPLYGGRDVVGFVDAQGVKHGKVEINPAELGLTNLIPYKSGRWWGKQRETDILMGRLLSDLCDTPKPVVEVIAHRAPIDLMPTPPPLSFQNIESAIDFVNGWAMKNSATLTVEDNTVFAEVRQRIGRKK